MPVSPPVKLDVRAQPSPLRGEMAIRYGAAYASTLIAVGAAATLPPTQLPRPFVWLLFAITLLGLPVSLMLRFSGLRVGGYRLPRFLLALIITVINVVAILFLVIDPLQKRIGASLLSPDFFRAFFFHHDADDAILIVLQVIALIMVCRCLVVITDKDAVLCTVPAFCILVLLIVVERQPGVVAFFVLWAAMAGVLFTLDQRQELARQASAFVPAFLPGQSTTLSARTLGGVMAFSLLCAGILSYTVTSRIENRSMAESWISSLAMQLTQFATALPETSVNAGPERQIDFTSGPALPTRSPLWTMIAHDLRTGKTVTPAYWRMFTLAHYNGTSWLQADQEVRRVPLGVLGDVGLVRPLPLRLDRNPGDMGNGRRRVRGFDLNPASKDKKPLLQPTPSFGFPTRVLRVQAIARQANIGFVPHLPALRYLAMPRSNPDYLTAYPDDSVDVRFVEPRQLITMVCEVPSGEDFGVPGEGPPLTTTQRPNPRARLSPAERQIYLQLPTAKLERVRGFAQNNLARLPANASHYAKAAHLAEVLRKHATYTLRPPALPQGRDATDYFLFESRKGYCTYFAGALAVLCRSAGIPSRVASGFTMGEQTENFSYLVRESNAHAWTEVWVPNWGWATLDAVPADERGDNAGDWWTNWADALNSVWQNAQSWLGRHWILIGGVLLALGLSGFAFYHERATLPARRLASLRLRRRRVSDKAARREVDEVYERAASALQKHFRPRAPWETPHEWLQAAEKSLHLKNPTPLQHLTDLYVQAQYSSHELGADESQHAWRALNEISWEREK